MRISDWSSDVCSSDLLFTLTDKAEQDDSCVGIYNKSLLYLVAHAFEQQARSWIDRRLAQGTPIAGMARFIAAKTVADQAYGFERVHALLKSGRLDWVQSPAAGQTPGSPNGDNASTHGGFDDERATLEATIARILGQRSRHHVEFELHRSETGMRAHRQAICRALET